MSSSTFDCASSCLKSPLTTSRSPRDDDLRTLVGRLCEAELRQRCLPLTALTYGGDQDARDGGIDLRIDLPETIIPGDFLPRAKIGFQVKEARYAAIRHFIRDVSSWNSTALYCGPRSRGWRVCDYQFWCQHF